MHIEYVGNKPIISHRGVDFSIGKEDKYLYIEPVTQILTFLQNLQSDSSMNIKTKKTLNEEESLKLLYSHRNDFNKYYDKKIEAYKAKIEKEISSIEKKDSLSSIEKEVLKNNFIYMIPYRLQRVTNKLVYEELVNICTKIIISKNIKELCMPLSMPFVHVAKSFESSLALISKSTVATVEVMLDKSEPYTKLSIKGFGRI